MSIVHDDCGERQPSVDRMIDEFRKAQSRRLEARTGKGDDQAAELQRDADGQAAVAAPAPTPTSH
jgi:hypothetical protein